jgi:phosphoenolpyruvate-protein phosphotransferase
MARLILSSPLAGWALPIEEIPDPVFAQRMAGDGVGIDPTGNVLHAPCAGEVFPIAGARHALGLRTQDGGEILLHLGIDTVALAGAGFETLVAAGEQVERGQALMRFDLELVARRAPSAVTPIVLPGGGKVLRSAPHRLLAVGDFLMEVEFGEALDAPVAGEAGTAGPTLRRSFRLPFDHGLHARPAAQVVAALRPFAAIVALRARNGSANARSTIAMMALGSHYGDLIEASASGEDAAAALDALAGLLDPADATGPAGAKDPPEPAPIGTATDASVGMLPGQIASRGLALGRAAYLPRTEFEFAERAESPARERDALRAAIVAVHAQLATLASAQAGVGQGILQAHAELVVDPSLADQAEAQIAQGSSAAHAWRGAIAGAMQALSAHADARMQERLADLRDIEQQVLAAIAGKPTGAQAASGLPDGAILLADELLPSQLIGLDRDRLAGVCTARGGPTSHVAIIAAALGIPALVAVGPRLLGISAGTTVWLDAERGFLQVSPSAAEQAHLAQALDARRQQDAVDLASAARPATTVDGVHVAVFANLGAVHEARAAVTRGAEGCGLLRTEFLFLQRQSPPGEDEQFEQYRQIRDALAPRVLTIRTMDIGGDKPIPYLPLPAEDNPALGLRGLRTSLAHPALLRTQLRAILRLRSPDTCRILLPMVTDQGDLRAVRAMLRECADELGIPELPRLGAMVETPASALLAEQLLEEADFLSIGSNDLSQYVLAMDRGHPQLSARLDALHPAVLRLIESVAARGAARGREVAVCGGLGSDPQAIALLVGLGIREVSAVPGAIPRIKRIIRSLDVVHCRELARQAMNLTDAAAVRQLVAKATADTEGRP